MSDYISFYDESRMNTFWINNKDLKMDVGDFTKELD